MDDAEKNTKRVTDVESSLMHLQSDFDSLNEIVLDNVRRLDKLTALVQRVTDRLDSAGDDEAPRDPEDEKPPHY
jgi:SlyX protein